MALADCGIKELVSSVIHLSKRYWIIANYMRLLRIDVGQFGTRVFEHRQSVLLLYPLVHSDHKVCLPIRYLSGMGRRIVGLGNLLKCKSPRLLFINIFAQFAVLGSIRMMLGKDSCLDEIGGGLGVHAYLLLVD